MKQDVVEGMDEVAVSLDTGLEQQHVRYPSKRCNNTHASYLHYGEPLLWHSHHDHD